MPNRPHDYLCILHAKETGFWTYIAFYTTNKESTKILKKINSIVLLYLYVCAPSVLNTVGCVFLRVNVPFEVKLTVVSCAQMRRSKQIVKNLKKTRELKSEF